MKLFSPSSRALTRSEVRLVNRRRLLVPAILGGLLLNLGVFAGGLWVGSSLEQPQSVVHYAAAEPVVEELVTVDRVGVLVGRLQALETDVLSLRRMLGEHQTLTQQLSALDPSLLPELVPTRPADAGLGQGGLLLAPRTCAEEELEEAASALQGLQHGEEVARCLRSQLDQLLEGVAQRNAALMAVPSRRPVPDNARLGSMYGNRIDPFKKHLAFHSGVDFAAHTGTDVLAAAGGRVRFASRRGGYGKLVEIDHGNGLVTRYAHLSRYDVRKGDVVTPGQRIGAVGSTGRSTGPHLHFEVLRHGRFVNPQRFLALADLERDADALAHD